MKKLMSSKFIFVVALLVASVTVQGCLWDNEDNSYQGPPVIEFSPAPGSSNTYSRTVTLAATSTAETNVTVKIQLVGPHQTSNVDVTFEVVNTSTATAGVHFTIASNTVTIPSGSSFAEIPVKVLGAGFNAGESKTVVLRLTGGGLAISENYKTFTLTIRKNS